MKYKKGESGEIGFILSVVIFQAFIILGLGFLNITPTTQTVGGDVDISLLPKISFTQTVITNIELLGWGNLLIFAPLIVVLLYLVAKLIRGN